MKRSSLHINGKLWTLEGGKIMGILNRTPDSFYAGSRVNLQGIVDEVGKMLMEGADFLDIGGYSTRPNATPVPLSEEMDRIIPVVEILQKHFPDAPLSIDTFRSEVARAAIEQGAGIINDISAGAFDPEMWPLITATKTPYIAMHMEGTLEDLHPKVNYDHVLKAVFQRFSEFDQKAQLAGIPDLILDPGFGFSKTLEENHLILHNLAYFNFFNRPMVIGLSRKRMIYEVLKSTADEALFGTLSAHCIAALQGDFIYRVHDVKATRDCLEVIRYGKQKAQQ